MKPAGKLLIIFIVPFLSWSLWGCSDSEFRSQSFSTLEVWLDADAKTLEILKEIAGNFEKDGRKYKTNFRKIGFDDLKPTILGSVKRKNTKPDLIMFSSDWLGELAKQKIVIKSELPQVIASDYLDQAKEAMRYQENFYGRPWSLDCIALLYNRNFIASPPADFAELSSVAEKLPEGVFPLLYDNKNFYFHVPWLHSFAGKIFENGKILPDCSKAAESFDFAWQLEHDFGIVPPKANQPAAINLFCARQAAMTINGPWIINEVRRNEIDFGVGAIPSIKENARPYVGVKGFAITTFCTNTDAATELLDLLTSRSTIERLSKESLLVPCYKSLANSEKIPDWIKGFLKQAKDGVLIPSDPAMKFCWAELNRALRIRFTGNLTSKELVSEAKERIEQAIAQEKMLK